MTHDEAEAMLDELLDAEDSLAVLDSAMEGLEQLTDDINTHHAMEHLRSSYQEIARSASLLRLSILACMVR